MLICPSPRRREPRGGRSTSRPTLPAPGSLQHRASRANRVVCGVRDNQDRRCEAHDSKVSIACSFGVNRGNNHASLASGNHRRQGPEQERNNASLGLNHPIQPCFEPLIPATRPSPDPVHSSQSNLLSPSSQRISVKPAPGRLPQDPPSQTIFATQCRSLAGPRVSEFSTRFG
jgi:hypothetical protein